MMISVLIFLLSCLMLFLVGSRFGAFTAFGFSGFLSGVSIISWVGVSGLICLIVPDFIGRKKIFPTRWKEARRMKIFPFTVDTNGGIFTVFHDLAEGSFLSLNSSGTIKVFVNCKKNGNKHDIGLLMAEELEITEVEDSADYLGVLVIYEKEFASHWFSLLAMAPCALKCSFFIPKGTQGQGNIKKSGITPLL